MTNKYFAKLHEKNKKRTNFVNKSLEILLAHATTEHDFQVINYALQDYKNQGYDLGKFIPKYEKVYEKFKQMKIKKEIKK